MSNLQDQMNYYFSHPAVTGHLADELHREMVYNPDVYQIISNNVGWMALNLVEQNYQSVDDLLAGKGDRVRSEDGYYYHGFNGVSGASIAKRGLDAEHDQLDGDDFTKVLSVFDRADATWVFPFKKHTGGRLSVSSEVQAACHYAYRAPEWFSIFLSNFGVGYDCLLKKDYAATKAALGAFIDRRIKPELREKGLRKLTQRQQQIDFCKRALERTPNSDGFRNLLAELENAESQDDNIEQDLETVWEFFEKYWNLFAGGEDNAPKLALVERADLTDVKKLNCQSDLYIEHSIPPEKVMIVDLPSYKQIVKSRPE
jgi:hypothetical protein